MSWRRVAAIYVVFALLATWILVAEHVTPPPPESTGPTAVGPAMLEADAASVTSVTFRKDGSAVRAIREDGRWRAIEPGGVRISSDLIEATIATLTAGQAAERLASEPQHGLAAYGLDAPSATLDLVVGSQTTPVTVSIGARNPTQTAVYARRSDQAAIYLVGMNLSYYIDLIFDAARS